MLNLSARRRRQLFPYLILAPGLLWLIVFFAIPLANQLYVSLQTGDAETRASVHAGRSTPTRRRSRTTPTQFLRSIQYAGAATIIDFIIAFPLAYFIAFKAGRWRNVMLLLVVLPFFVSYVLRTVAWQLILNDNGWVVARLRDVGVLSAGRPPARHEHAP